MWQLSVWCKVVSAPNLKLKHGVQFIHAGNFFNMKGYLYIRCINNNHTEVSESTFACVQGQAKASKCYDQRGE